MPWVQRYGFSSFHRVNLLSEFYKPKAAVFPLGLASTSLSLSSCLRRQLFSDFSVTFSPPASCGLAGDGVRPQNRRTAIHNSSLAQQEQPPFAWLCTLGDLSRSLLCRPGPLDANARSRHTQHVPRSSGGFIPSVSRYRFLCHIASLRQAQQGSMGSELLRQLIGS